MSFFSQAFAKIKEAAKDKFSEAIAKEPTLARAFASLTPEQNLEATPADPLPSKAVLASNAPPEIIADPQARVTSPTTDEATLTGTKVELPKDKNMKLILGGLAVLGIMYAVSKGVK